MSTAINMPAGTLSLISNIQSLVATDMAAVNRLIQHRLQSEVALVNQLGSYIINSGGKRMRPILVLLSAKAYNYHGQHHIALAAIIEFIHTATLLHDDVVDSSLMRRGQDSANALWGNEASVLVGDFLYSRAFEMMVEICDMQIMEILAHATNTIAEGEVMQLLNKHDAQTTEQSYLQVIRSKTAKLFEAGAQLGAVIGERSVPEQMAMADYGRHLGTAFQLIDDVLDYTGSPQQIGKNLGDDLADGKPTLPLIYAMQHGSPAQIEIITQALTEDGLAQIDQVTEVIQATKALDYTTARARAEATKARAAISQLAESVHKNALLDLVEFSVNRRY